MKRQLSCFIICLSLVACDSGPAEPEAEPGTVAWEGHVTSAVDGSPIPEISVGLFLFDTDGTLYYYGGFSGWIARTDSVGYYRIGDYWLGGALGDAFEGEVFLQARCNLLPPSGEECEFEDWHESERVYVSFKKGVHTIDLQLTPKYPSTSR